MKSATARIATDDVDQPRGRSAELRYRLRLYVAGTSPRSARAIVNIKELCAEHLDGRYTLQVIDLYQQPHLAKGDKIIAVPTLVRRLPLPRRRLIGDLSDRARVLNRLDVRPRP